MDFKEFPVECFYKTLEVSERHVRPLLLTYRAYYKFARTQLSLNKDAPVPQALPTIGRIHASPISADYAISMSGFGFR